MVSLSALWMPIVVSAVIVFIVSSIMHTVLKYHHRAIHRLPDEETLTAAMRTAGVKQGLYMFPHCDPKNMKSPEMQEKYKQGPIGMLTVLPNGMPNMPKFLGLWFVYCLVIGLFTAYVTGHVLPAGTPYLSVFRVAGTVAFMSYGLGHLSNGIWKGQPWGVVFTEVVDGFVYGLMTAGTFGWLWPK